MTGKPRLLVVLPDPPVEGNGMFQSSIKPRINQNCLIFPQLDLKQLWAWFAQGSWTEPEHHSRFWSDPQAPILHNDIFIKGFSASFHSFL